MTNHLSLEKINELFGYNYWARDRQLQVCENLSPDQLKSPIGGSFSSLHNTLVHLVVVEWLWRERWRGRTPHPIPRVSDFPSLADIIERWNNEEIKMKSYLASLTENDLENLITCQSTRGDKWTYPLWQMMMHLLNHQSFHRGQVTFYFRQLGLQPPSVDLMDGLGLDFKTTNRVKTDSDTTR